MRGLPGSPVFSEGDGDPDSLAWRRSFIQKFLELDRLKVLYPGNRR